MDNVSLVILHFLRGERVYLVSNLINNIELQRRILKYRKFENTTHIIVSMWKESSRLSMLKDLQSSDLTIDMKQEVCNFLFNTYLLDDIISFAELNGSASEEILKRGDLIQDRINSIRFEYEKSIAKFEDRIEKIKS